MISNNQKSYLKNAPQPQKNSGFFHFRQDDYVGGGYPLKRVKSPWETYNPLHLPHHLSPLHLPQVFCQVKK